MGVIKKLLSPAGLLWLSVLILGIGTRLRELSPRFEEWFNSLSASSDMEPGLGLALGVSSIFVTTIWVMGVFCFLGAVAVVTWILRWNKVPGSIKAGILVVFSMCCTWVSISLIASAVDSLEWGFVLVACGELLTAIGIVSNVVKVAKDYVS